MKLSNFKYLLVCIIGLITLKSNAQLPASVIFSVAGNHVSVEEFEKQYLKSQPQGLDEYLRLYTDFKLKYQDAKDAGMDTIQSYISELIGYRRDLARNYLFDKEVTESLIAEAYDRWQYEVRVKHILVFFKENPTPADTLEAFKKIQGIYSQLIKDPSKFEELAKTNSEDPGTKENGGDLGYLSVFQVVYPFENEAFNTPIGGISKVFKTQFGYHILKVEDKRRNRGELKVRRILLRVGLKPDATEENVKRKMAEIYNKIKSGEATFESMAKSYSEDVGTNTMGGETEYFSATQKVGDLDFQYWAEQAFGLGANFSYTEPFKSGNNWHLIQKLDLKPVGSLSQLRLIIKNQVQNDQRAQKSLDALINKVKKENNLQEYSASLQALISSLDTNFVKGNFSISTLPKFAKATKAKTPIKGNVFEEPNPSTTPLLDLKLVSLNDENHNVEEFAKYLQSTMRPTNLTVNAHVSNLYTEWVNGICVDFQDKHLDEKSPEFHYLYQEYREGILMFNRMQITVWEKANNDSAGLLAFHNQHKNEYMWTDRYDCQVYLCANKKIMDGVAKQIKKNILADSIKRKENASNPLNLDYRIGRYELSDSFLFPDKRDLEYLFANPKRYKPKKIVKLNQIGNDWVVVKVNKFLPAAPKLLDETRGPVAAKYQDYLELKWIEDLRKKYTVVVNNEALEALRKKLAEH